jgi:hypothetical protein
LISVSSRRSTLSDCLGLIGMSTTQPSRDPGAEIKRALRSEVNFGCPVRFPDGTGCGSPVLTYHHFDPPWAGNFVHNPDGMIALCPLHHGQADGGMWTNDQFRKMKRFPYVDDALRVQWPWQPEALVMKVGRSLVVGNGSPIRLRGKPVMMFRPAMIDTLNIRTIAFDSEIADSEMRPWLRIEDNWFDLRLDGTTDVTFSPQHRSFMAKRNDTTYVALKFRKVPIADFQEWSSRFIDKPSILETISNSVEKAKAIDSDGNVPVMEFEGSFRTNEVNLNICDDSMMFESFIPGLRERFEWHSWVVNGTNRAILKIKNGSEFFSLG